MTNGLCHTCFSSNVEIGFKNGKPICKFCENPELIKKQPQTYTKNTPITAIQMDNDFTVETLEGTMKGHAGDYLATGINGEKYPIAKKIFERSYKKT